MSRAWCNLHALSALLWALSGCNQGSSDADRPAPRGGGSTDIFGSAPVAQAPLPDAGATDAGPTDAVALAGGDAGADPCKLDAGPGCPMLRSMKGPITAAFAAKKAPELIAALATITSSAPAGYANWASISRDGAAAAKAGQWSAVKASCRGCHAQYKLKYIAEHRSEPLH